MQYQAGTHPISLVCVAAPSDEVLLSHWENHLLPLQQAGLLTFWSERQIAAGADRMRELDHHLEQSDGVILLLSADFFADNTCLTFMREVLERRSANRIRLIPLLVRPVAWQESELGTFAALPTNGIAITTWESPDEGWRQAVLGLSRLLGLPVRTVSSVNKGAATDRERMLRRLHRTYQTSLEDSLQGIAWMELGLAGHPDAVENATHVLHRLPDRSEHLLPAGTSILSVYDRAGDLLILGAPGSGKSTLLLGLALDLVMRAEDDATLPLPVIVPLSSWAVNKPLLADWLIEQLARIYDVPRNLGRLCAQVFLDDATSRILLRRIGGGYSFIHRRLLDYFALFSDASWRPPH
jgi:TIR domain